MRVCNGACALEDLDRAIQAVGVGGAACEDVHQLVMRGVICIVKGVNGHQGAFALCDVAAEILVARLFFAYEVEQIVLNLKRQASVQASGVAPL